MMFRRQKIGMAAGGVVVALVAGAVAAAPAAYAAAPANDSVAHPRVISAVPTIPSIQQNTSGATHAKSDPKGVYGASVWYQFKPATAVTARVVTLGSSYDAALAVFRGQATDANRIASDQYRFDPGAGVVVRFQAGVRYLIAVSNAWGSRGGSMTLTLYPSRKPQVEATITGVKAGQVSGKLFVTGTLRFNNPSYGYLYVEVDQLVGEHVVYGGAEIYPTNAGVDQTQTWQMTIYSGTGWAYSPGQPATVETYAGGWDGWQEVGVDTTSTVTIDAGPGLSAK